tara:strand:+ start:318 stop:521 length:204 start_codon:yes stop_codon:yes gene_type:complete
MQVEVDQDKVVVQVDHYLEERVELVVVEMVLEQEVVVQQEQIIQVVEVEVEVIPHQVQEQEHQEEVV